MGSVAAPKTSAARARDELMPVMMAARQVITGSARTGKNSVDLDTLNQRFAKLGREVTAAPTTPPGDFDPDAWAVFLLAAKVASSAPYSLRELTLRTLSAAGEVLVRLDDEVRRRDEEGITDEERPFWTRD